MSQMHPWEEAKARIEAQAAEIEYWKTEARNVRRELKSEQKQADSAMDNYDAMQRRVEAQAAEIVKLREALKHQGGPLCMARYHPTAECTCGVSAALGETK